jgi:hypothetical protein
MMTPLRCDREGCNAFAVFHLSDRSAETHLCVEHASDLLRPSRQSTAVQNEYPPSVVEVLFQIPSQSATQAGGYVWPAQVALDIAHSISPQVANDLKVLPIVVNDGVAVVAAACHLRREDMDLLRFCLNHELRVVRVTEESLLLGIQICYDSNT